MHLTSDWLRSKGACSDGLEAFERIFGKQAEITLENCQRAVDEELDINWLVEHLPAPARKLCNESRAAALKLFNESRAPAWKLYEESTAPAYKLYNESTVAAWKLCEESTAAAWKLYEESTAPAYKLYNESTVAALCEALKSVEEVTPPEYPR